jgi:hypothetical protein
MYNNVWTPMAKLIWIADNLESYKINNEKVVYVDALVSIRRPYQNVNSETGKREYREDIYEIRFTGKNAENLYKYGRNFYTSGEKKGKLIARSLWLRCYPEKFNGTVRNIEDFIQTVKLQGKELKLKFAQGKLGIKAEKVRLKGFAFQFMDYIEQKESNNKASNVEDDDTLEVSIVDEDNTNVSSTKKPVQTKTSDIDNQDMPDDYYIDLSDDEDDLPF